MRLIGTKSDRKMADGKTGKWLTKNERQKNGGRKENEN